MYRVGYLSLGSQSAALALPETSGVGFNGFRRRLRDLGWTEGGSLVIEARYAEGKREQLKKVTLGVGLLVLVLTRSGSARARARLGEKRIMSDHRAASLLPLISAR